MADNIPLSFLVGLNIDDLKAKADEGKKKFEELGRHAEKEGAYIDALFQHLGKGFDVSTVEGKMNALRSAISDNTLTLKQWGENVDLWSKQANQAFAKGDFPLFDVINKDIVQTKGDMKDLEAETAYLIKVLQQMEESVGNISQSGSNAPRLFTTEEDYQHVKELEEEIDNLTSKLAQAGTDTEFTQINGQIIELQQELDGCNAKATEAAAALGDHLGGKAAESSTRLYELNATLAAQQKTYDDLVQKLEDVAQKMEAASAAGDVSQLKDLQLEYQHLAEQVENANNALQETKGEQKDAAAGWEDMLGTIASLGQEVETSTRPVGQAITSFSQLSRAFSTAKNPATVFRAALSALRGGLSLTQVSFKGVIGAIKALGKAMLSNPFTAILLAITAVVAGIVALVKSIETQAEKQKRLNEQQANYLELLQQTEQYHNNKIDDAIKAKERELEVAKSANKSLREQYQIEDELNQLKRHRAIRDAAYYAEEIENIDKNRDALLQLQQELSRANDAKAMGDKKVTITIDGKTSKQKVDEAIENLQGAIKNRELLIKLGVDARDALEQQRANEEKTANERREKAKQIAATERSTLRETQKLRISLEQDTYKREIAQAKANAENKIKDLRLRLSQESNLSKAARKAINDQILLQQQKLNNDLEKLEREHQSKLLAIRRQVEDTMVDSGAKTAEEQRTALMQEYMRLKEDVDARIMNPETSDDEVKELMKLREAYNKRYLAEKQILELQLQQQAIETEKETINLRLSAVREGTLEELNLRLQLIEAERRAELQANKLKPEDQRQDEEDINAKYRRQREDEEKAFYASVIGAYADYQQEMLDMTTAFESRRAQLEQQISQERDPKKKQALQKSLAELEKTYKASLKSLQQEFIKNNIGDVFNEQTVENIKEAKRALDEMEAMSLEDFNLAYQAHLSADEFEKLKEQIRKVRNELRDMSKGYSLKDAFSDAFTGKTKEEVQRGVDYIVNGFNKVSNVASGIASAMREFAEATNNAKLEKMADTFDSIADTISTAGGYAAAGAQIGGGWGAVIGAVLGIGQGVFTSIFKSKAQEEAENKARIDESISYMTDILAGINSISDSVKSMAGTISGLDYKNYAAAILEFINTANENKFDADRSAHSWRDAMNQNGFGANSTSGVWASLYYFNPDGTPNAAFNQLLASAEAYTQMYERYMQQADYYAQRAEEYRQRGDTYWANYYDEQAEHYRQLAQHYTNHNYSNITESLQNNYGDAAWWLRDLMYQRAGGSGDPFAGGLEHISDEVFNQIYEGALRILAERGPEGNNHNNAYSIGNGVAWSIAQYVQEQYDALEKLKEAFEDAYWDNSYDSTGLFNLSNQSLQINKNIYEAEYLASLLAGDEEKAAEYLRKIREIEFQMSESLRTMFESLAGSDLQSIVNKWLDIFKEFGNNFEAAIDKINESINDMIRNMIVQTVFVQPLMQRLNRYIQDYAATHNLEQDEDGNYIWTNEAFRGMAEGLKTQVEGAKELYQQLLGELNAAGLGWGDAANDRSASARGIATASQDSVDELNGRATTIQGHTFNISENSNIIRDNTTAILGSVRQIEMNTQHLIRIDNDIHTLQITISDLSSQGVRLRNN